MKSILVGKSGNDRIYFVIDSDNQNSDCVVKNILGDTRVTNFWDYVDNHKMMTKISGTPFHNYLWNGHASSTNIHWYSIFVSKSLPVDSEILDGVVVNNDILNRVQTLLSYENRAEEFRLAKNTGQWSQKMIANWIDLPERKFKRGKRKKKSRNE
jgi:hypothetical protein